MAFLVSALVWNTSFLFRKKFSREDRILAPAPAAAVRGKPRRQPFSRPLSRVKATVSTTAQVRELTVYRKKWARISL